VETYKYFAESLPLLSQTCLGCRARGHTLKTCPQAASLESGGPSKPPIKMCYNCGEEGHNLSGCKKPIKEGESAVPPVPGYGALMLPVVSCKCLLFLG
jgi:hypothetical protein